MDVRLDGVFTDEAVQIAELSARSAPDVAYQEITEIDLIHGHMLIDVRLKPGPGVVEPPHPKVHHSGRRPAVEPAGPGGFAARGAR